MPFKSSSTLLIIDDSPEDRVMFADHIRRNAKHVDYQIIEAATVEEGLALCEEVAVDCVIVDYRLPDATGVDFLRGLFENEQHKNIGVVFVTGMGSEEIAVSAMREGAVDYVSKANMSSDALLRALDHARTASEAARKLEQAEHARKVAQSEQMRSEGDLQRLMESIRDYAIITLDLGGRVARWGAGARRLLGYHDNEALGLRFADMLHNTDTAQTDAEQELEHATHGPVNCDGRWFVRRDGGLFWATSLLTPIDDELGGACGFALVIHDISAWRDITRGISSALAPSKQVPAGAGKALRAPVRQLLAGLEQLCEMPEDQSHARVLAAQTLLNRARKLDEAIEEMGQEPRDTAPSGDGEKQVSLGEVLKHYTHTSGMTTNAPVGLRGEAADVRGPWDAHMLLQAFENIFSHARSIDPQVSIEVHPRREGDLVSVGIECNAESTAIFLPYAREIRDDSPADLRLAVARFIIENLGGRIGERRVHQNRVGLQIFLPLAESAHA